MNALEDTREIVTVHSAPDNWVDSPQPRARFIAGYLDDLITLHPSVELASIRIHEMDGVVTITGRVGPLIATLDVEVISYPVQLPLDSTPMVDDIFNDHEVTG